MKLNNETKVGILATLAIVLLVVGYLFLKGRRIFNDGFVLKSYYENSGGLLQGNPVLYNGVKIGEVRSIDLDPNTGQIAVEYVINEELLIPVDSKAKISSADLLGSKAITLDRGTSNQYVKSGGTLDGEVEEAIQDMVLREILPIKDQIEGLVGEMERFVQWVNTTLDQSASNKIDRILDDFQAMSRTFRGIAGQTESIVGGMNRTVQNIDGTVAELRSQTGHIDQIMANTQRFTDSLAAASGSAKDVIDRTSDAVGNLNDLLAQAGDPNGTLGKMMTDTTLYTSVVSSVQSLDSLVQAITANPTVYVKVYPTLRDPEKQRAKELEKAQRQKEKEARKNQNSGASSGDDE